MIANPVRSSPTTPTVVAASRSATRRSRRNAPEEGLDGRLRVRTGARRPIARRDLVQHAGVDQPVQPVPQPLRVDVRQLPDHLVGRRAPVESGAEGVREECGEAALETQPGMIGDDRGVPVDAVHPRARAEAQARCARRLSRQTG